MSNGTNENGIIKHKRRGYLAYFKDGVHDAIINEEQNVDKTFSDYYKQGYKHGLYIKDKLLIKEIPYG
jgi:hypothetical protein|tara:strand:+ start:1289 stop:1492 length:204 start_codon:yes stop_codon:yes gene_type:complete